MKESQPDGAQGRAPSTDSGTTPDCGAGGRTASAAADALTVFDRRLPSAGPKDRPDPAGQSHRDRIRAHFESVAAQRDAWLDKAAYYHMDLRRLMRFLIPPGKRVAEIGCGAGDLLRAVEPCVGLGLDISPAMIEVARRRHPDLQFAVDDAENLQARGEFDYLILSNLIGNLYDVQTALRQLRALCTDDTRLVITHYSRLWHPVLQFAERVGLKMPQPPQSWLSPEDVAGLLALTDYEVIKTDFRMLCPLFVPGLSWLLNRVVAHLPGFRHLCLTSFMVARPRPAESKTLSVSLIIPARNEAGNIRSAVERTPPLGRHTEFIFIEGHSSDGTLEAMHKAQSDFPQADIKVMVQTGRNKANAVFEALRQATGDLVMILDSDLTMPPEELPKFYDALAEGRAEFVNGCRLVYPMEKDAMRFLNTVANHAFAVFFTWLLGTRVKDTLCGTKALSRAHCEEIRRNTAYFGDFDPFGDFQLLFGAVKLNLRLIDVPVHYKARKYGETQIRRFRDGFLLIRMVLVAMRKLKFV